jgi:hypothetical protein
MLDVALASLIEDMIEKAGPDGVVEFWQRVGDALASRMGKEAYLGWTSFNVAVREGRTAFSIEGDVTPLTDMAITDVIMFWPLSWLQMWARFPFSRFRRRYSRGFSSFGIEDAKIRPSTPRNIAMSSALSSRHRRSSVSRRSLRWPTVSAPIVLSTLPA